MGREKRRMIDYVSKEQLEEFFKGVTITVTGRTRGEAIRAAYAIEILKAIYNGVMKLPTTDAVPVIRCRVCLKKRLCSLYRETNDENGFCAWGKRE